MEEVAAQATQQTGAELVHTVYPKCRCGHARDAHRCQGWYPITSTAGHDDCQCYTYSPTLPVEEFTSAYRPWSTTRGMRRLGCLAAWRVEQWARNTRRRLERRV